MIEARELRKDNWVNAKHQGQTGINPYRIVAIEETTVKLANYHLLPEESVSDCEYADLEPIPLTPEILKKAGLKKHISSDKVMEHYFLKDIILLSRVVGRSDFYLEHYRPSSGNVIVKYLHQFQNLYFALTGEELNIKL